MPIPEITPYPMPAPDELPKSSVHWTVDPRRAVLLVHDMQRYFLRAFPSGTEPLSSLLANAAALRSAFVRAGAPVAYTAQPGSMTPHQRGLLRDFWGPGMTAGPEDREVVDEVTAGPEDWMLTKWRYSAFHRTDLLERMRRSGRDQLVCVGVYAHVGLLATTVDAMSHDIQAFLVADAVADFSAEDHRMALAYAAARTASVAATTWVLEGLEAKGAAA
ncbi:MULTISPECIES: isochorismatase family protein [Nocardiopsis]|uniref:isochorismatase family protein n=1 Tax=Nocardiopsis TaxID=2013 RepID=UPI000375A49A|nr:isochorismatase family protein [Nocardiopsis sp. CNS-639]